MTIASKRRPAQRARTKDIASPELERRADGRLVARLDGDEHVVQIGRCFPWSQPTSFLSLRDDDGREVALVHDPGQLDAASRAALEAALAEADFVFDVTAVTLVEEEVELRHWHVTTAQGERSFQTRLDDWPRRLPDGGLLIRDVGGDLYRLADIDTLDRRSRTLLWAFTD